jgi:hypothetical protein
MPKVPTSIHREIGADDIRSFSSFDDYVKPHIDDGSVESIDDLVSRRPELLGRILFDWYKDGQIACVFARVLAAKKDKPKWRTITIEEGEINVEKLEATLLEAISKEFDAVQFIFPGAGTAQRTVELIKTLCEHPSWSCREMPWMTDDEGRLIELGNTVQVGLRWHPPESDYVSWVLGIAPFDTMPFTRRFVNAPFIALVMRPTAPTDFVKEKKFEGGFQASHLAHMNDMLGSNDPIRDEQMREDFRARTRRTKFALVRAGGELLSTARAQVTFSLPLWCREALGNTLTPIVSGDEPQVGRRLSNPVVNKG